MTTRIRVPKIYLFIGSSNVHLAMFPETLKQFSSMFFRSTEY